MAMDIPGHRHPNAQTQGGWKGTQVSWAGRGTGEGSQIHQDPRGLGSLPSTAERCSGGGNWDTQFPRGCKAGVGVGALELLGSALWAQAHPRSAPHCTLAHLLTLVMRENDGKHRAPNPQY